MRKIKILILGLLISYGVNAQVYTPGGSIQGPSGNNYLGIGIQPLYNLHSASSNNTATASSFLWGQYYGTFISTQSTSSSHYALNVASGLASNGSGTATNLFTVKADGKVGIGTTSPQMNLEVLGWGQVIRNTPANAYTTLRLYNNLNSAVRALEIDYSGSTYAGSLLASGPVGESASITTTGAYPLSFGTGNTSRMTIAANGDVGIGTYQPDAKLAVKGTVHAQEVKVDLNVPGPDYVFEENYNLTLLSELETYIKQNKHLPEVPSAKEMEMNGINLGEMNMLLLKKIEELTLHVIAQQKEIEKLKSKIK